MNSPSISPKFTEEIIEQVALMLLPLGLVNHPRGLLLALAVSERPADRKVLHQQQHWSTGTALTRIHLLPAYVQIMKISSRRIH